MTIEMFVAIGVVVFLFVPYAYVVGLAFSRGFHKGKREFLRQAMGVSLAGEKVDG